jgi:hypothetical protein
MAVHRVQYVSAGLGPQVVRSISGLAEHTHDGIDRVTIATDSALDVLASVRIALNNPHSVVVTNP